MQPCTSPAAWHNNTFQQPASSVQLPHSVFSAFPSLRAAAAAAVGLLPAERSAFSLACIWDKSSSTSSYIWEGWQGR